MKIVVYIITLFLFILSNFTLSQTDTTYLQTEDILEELIEESSEETDNSELFDRFEYLINNPVDLNKADLTQLLQIPFIDIYTANTIINHRNKFGFFYSVQELFAIKNLSKEVINKILPFLTVKERPAQIISDEPVKKDFALSFKNINFNLRNRVMNDLQNRRGFLEDIYAGSKLKSYNRLLVRLGNNYQLGILSDKDPGEKSYTDFVSYHFFIRNIGVLSAFALGDYLLEFGQGLALWSPYAISKSSDAIYPVKKSARGVRPYTSSTEVNFLRGAASTIQFDKISLTAFYSQNKFDASIDTITGLITFRPEDGYHRTENEILRKSSAEEKLFGGAIQFNPFNPIHIGLLAYSVQLSNPIKPSSKYGLNGDEFKYYSIFYDVIFSGINLFGEFSYDQTSVASVNGLQFSVTRNFSLITAFRNYPRNYNNYRGSGFGERAGTTSNEIGFYTGIRWRIPFGILNFYYDQFKYPYRTYTNVFPSDGDEILAELSSKPFKSTETKFRYKYENKDITQSFNGLKQLLKRLRQAFRIEIIHTLSRSLRLRSRAEYNHFNINSIQMKEDGYLFFQDVRYSPKSELVFYGRIIFFKTDSFNSAVYEYENDLTGVMTNLPMYGEGLRWYFMVRYQIVKMITMSFKYSETYKPNEETLSSGNNLIFNNIDNRMSIQLDLSF